jgi:hypothetical protein
LIDSHRTLARSVAYVGIFMAALVPLLLNPLVPTIDFYNHLARYFVLAHVDTSRFLSENYQADWKILPNIGLDVLGVGVMKLLPPLLAGRAIITLIFATQYFGVLFFNRQLNGWASPSVALLVVPLLYSFILTWGFANFLLGLGLVFWAAACWLKLRHRPLVAVPLGCLFAVLIFLCHGVAFALYGLLLGGLELGFFLQSRPRSLWTLGKSMAFLGAQAVVPVVLFLVSSTSRSEAGLTTADESIRQLSQSGLLLQRLQELGWYRLVTIVRVAESPSPWFDGLSLAATLLILGLLASRGRLRIAKAAWPAIALGMGLVALVPPTLFGVGYVADRMPLFAAFLCVGSLSFTLKRQTIDWLCVAALIALTALRLVLIDLDWRSYRGELQAFRSTAARIPPDQVVGFFNGAGKERLAEGHRCEMYGPLLVPVAGQAAPLFAFTTQQPMKLKGDLARAAQLPQTTPHTAAEDDPANRMRAMLREGYFRYILTCDAPAGLATPAAGVEVTAHNGRFTLLHRLIGPTR